jgi:hypothetical protein
MCGNGHEGNGPDDGARPRGPGSGQPTRETAADVGWESIFTVHGVKGEGARRAVKGGPAMGAPVTRARGDDATERWCSDPPLSAEGKLRRAGTTP